MGGLSLWHLLIVLAIALVIFGTKKIRDLGGDLGGAIRNFKSAVRESEDEPEPEPEETPAVAQKKVGRVEKKQPRVIEGKVESKVEGKTTTTRRRKKT